jgi:hypothetical protein
MLRHSIATDQDIAITAVAGWKTAVWIVAASNKFRHYPLREN